MPGSSARTAAMTWRAEGLTIAVVPTTTVGTVSSPPVMARTAAAAAGSSQMLISSTGSRDRRSPSRSIAQYGHPVGQATARPAPCFLSRAGHALDPHPAPERDVPGDPARRRAGLRVVPGRVPVDRAVHADVVVAGLALPRAGAGSRAGGEILPTQRPRREVVVALHLDRALAFGQHGPVPHGPEHDPLHG